MDQKAFFLFKFKIVLCCAKLAPLTVNDFTVKNTFQFAEEIRQQDSQLYMASLDINSLFTNIPLEKTISICNSLRIVND